MNIMLITVTERTKEIGLKKSVGAYRSVLLTEFLVEALMLSSGGGLDSLFYNGNSNSDPADRGYPWIRRHAAGWIDIRDDSGVAGGTAKLTRNGSV